MSKSFKERRKVSLGSFTYLVDDDDLTAWIYEGCSNGERVLKLPESVALKGRTYRITSVEIGGYCDEDSLEELFIPDCYEFIDEDAFRGCENLRTVHIGKGLRWYCKWSFNGSPLEKVEIDPGNPYMKVSDDGSCALSKDGKTLMYNFLQKKSLTVQEGVEEIAGCAVSCNELTEEITLPRSLKKLGPNAIFECKRLKRLTFKEGFEEAGLQSLAWNEELREIDFPSTLRKLGDEAITDDHNLEKITLRSPSVVDIDANETFSKADYPMQTCHLYVPASLVESYKKHPFWGRFTHIEAIV